MATAGLTGAPTALCRRVPAHRPWHRPQGTWSASPTPRTTQLIGKEGGPPHKDPVNPPGAGGIGAGRCDSPGFTHPDIPGRGRRPRGRTFPESPDGAVPLDTPITWRAPSHSAFGDMGTKRGTASCSFFFFFFTEMMALQDVCVWWQYQQVGWGRTEGSAVPGAYPAPLELSSPGQVELLTHHSPAQPPA